MRQHKFEVGDKVFILLRDSDLDEDSGFDDTMRNSIGEVTHIRTAENTPYIYIVIANSAVMISVFYCSV